MKKLLFFVACSAIIATPFMTRSQTMAMSPGVGSGARGYDFLVGTWTCVNKNPSPLSGPATSSFTATRANGTLFIRANGPNFQTASYLTFLPKTKTWNSPTAFGDGGYEIETSSGTGNKVTFAGTYYSPQGAATTVRDFYTFAGKTKQVDVGQVRTAGIWKTVYTITCNKS